FRSGPSVVQNSAEARLNSPCPAAKPASGRMISLGSGGNTFSSATNSPAPGAPSVSTRSAAHPALPPAGPWGRARVGRSTVGLQGRIGGGGAAALFPRQPRNRGPVAVRGLPPGPLRVPAPRILRETAGRSTAGGRPAPGRRPLSPRPPPRDLSTDLSTPTHAARP